MTMDTWIISQVSFWFIVRKVKPAHIVDQCINFFLDIAIPGRGAGQNNWIMRGVRTVQISTERTQKELDIRTNLRSWDNQFPEIHHELLIRWVCGAIASAFVTSCYQSLKPQRRNRKY